MDETKVVSVSTTIAAPPEAVFEEIADPARQIAWDGNDNLGASAPGQRVHAVGDVFMTTTTSGNDRYNHVYDWRELTDESRFARARNTTEANLRSSLDRLAAIFG